MPSIPTLPSLIPALKGDKGLYPEVYVSGTTYRQDTVLRFGTVVWRALRKTSATPSIAAPLDWEAFIADGEDGTPGTDGAPGADGADGPPGPTEAAPGWRTPPAPADLYAKFGSPQSYYASGVATTVFATWLAGISGTFTRGGTNHPMWDATGNLVQGTANQPRFSYDPITLKPCILYEPTASNMLSFSQEASNAVWAFSNQNITRADNGATGLDGTTSAGTFRETTTNGLHLSWHYDGAAGVTSGLSYAYKIYLKLVNRTRMRVFPSGSGIGSTPIIIDTAAGTCSDPTWKFTLLANGYFRLSKSFTATATAIINIRFYLLGTNDVDTYAGSTAAGWNLGGAQLELVASATSPPTTYIHRPTAAAASRSADALSFTLPASASKLTYTFASGYTQLVSVAPGAYSIPTNLNSSQIASLITTDLTAVAGPITSVAGRAGDVTLAQADVTGLRTTDIAQFAGLNIAGATYVFGPALFKTDAAGLQQWTAGNTPIFPGNYRGQIIGGGAAAAATFWNNSSVIGSQAAAACPSFGAACIWGDTAAAGATVSLNNCVVIGNEGGNGPATISSSNIIGNTTNLGFAGGGGLAVGIDVMGQAALRFNGATNTVAIGNQAGTGANTGVSQINQSVLLGAQAGSLSGGVAATTIVKQILIGFQAQAPTPTTSNYLNIGDSFKGDMSGGNYTLTSQTAGDAKLTLATLVLGTAVASPTASVSIQASTTVRALMNLPVGVVPTSPADGDIWRTSSGVFLRDSGTTKQFTLV